MTTNDPTVHVHAIQPRMPSWMGTKKLITIGAATVVAVAVDGCGRPVVSCRDRATRSANPGSPDDEG